MGGWLILILFALWLPQAIFLYLSWLYWVQVKEYRFDRFKVLLTSRESVNLLFFPKKFRKPVFTERVRNILLTTVIFLSVIFILLVRFPQFVLVWLAIGELFLIVSIFVGVMWTSLLVNRAKTKDIKLAMDKLDKVKPFVIGVTGSYGKSTTKDFIAQLLAAKYKTFKTPENKNTEFGVARAVINLMHEDTQVFVVEMGAYGLNEIKNIASIVSPQIGVITGIEPQHLATFGSLENIMTTKFELIESLPRGGTAIFNYSNPYSREMAEWARERGFQVLGYKLANSQNLKIKADIESKIISVKLKGVTFEVTVSGEKRRFFAPVAGVHFIENLTAAILIARLKDVSWDKIERAINHLEVSDRTMKVMTSKSGIIVIDDSYNATPAGFTAAVNYLSLFRGYKKIIVTPGIIELGSMSKKVHKDLAKNINALKIDKVILTNSEFKKEFTLLASIINNDEEFNTFIRRLPTKSVVLLEGRVPESFRKIVNYE